MLDTCGDGCGYAKVVFFYLYPSDACPRYLAVATLLMSKFPTRLRLNHGAKSMAPDFLLIAARGWYALVSLLYCLQRSRG
jgi:hypothetical protein